MPNANKSIALAAQDIELLTTHQDSNWRRLLCKVVEDRKLGESVQDGKSKLLEYKATG